MDHGLSYSFSLSHRLLLAIGIGLQRSNPTALLKGCSTGKAVEIWRTIPLLTVLRNFLSKRLRDRRAAVAPDSRIVDHIQGDLVVSTPFVIIAAGSLVRA
jgi:hypothetical protein